MDLIENKIRTMQQCSDNNLLASQIYVLCTNITPQFYRNLSADDMQTEITSIKMIISGIDAVTLAEMCQMAVAQYPTERSKDSKIYFDINYILKFFKQAYNKIHNDYIVLEKGTKLLSRYYDEVKSIVYEKWQYENNIIETSCVLNNKDDTSHKDFEAEFGVKWREHNKSNKLRIYDYTDEELIKMYQNIDIEL